MKKFAVVAILLIFALMSIAPSMAQSRVTITWFIGIGTGAQPEQQAAQEAVVAAFNDSQDRITLVMNVVENSVAADTLATLISTGNGPDIVGPTGNEGANSFIGNWLDLQPLVDANNYDLSQWPEDLVNFYRTEEGLVGLPFATFPSMIYYRPALFEEAGLNLPPANYGDPYVWDDGTEVEWTVDVLRELAMILTVDANGNDATMDSFDPENIVQWGFDFQWYGDGFQIPTIFGADRLLNVETGEAQFPDVWAEGFTWWYNGMWVDRFIPNAAQEGSDMLGAGNPFNSGNLAMAQSHLWYTCCLEGTAWNMAPIPSHNGVTTVRLHADTFRVFARTAHQQEAFEVLTYLVGPAALDLLEVYGGMPARVEEQAEFFARLDERYTQGVNWQVARDGLNYPDSPSHESWFPSYLEGRNRMRQFTTLLNSTPGLNLEAEFALYLADMQALFNEAQ